MTRRVEVIAPGLSGGFSDKECNNSVWSSHQFLLQKIIGRSNLLKEDESEAIRSGINSDHQFNLPLAMYEYRHYNHHGDGSKYCLYADAIYLEIKSDHAVLLDESAAQISKEEWENLAERFNQYFEDQGLSLERNGKRWFLRSDEKPCQTMFPTGAVVGRDVKHFMPSGKNASYWLQVLNETQMLFHSSPVNDQRRASGLPPVSGLWFWGGGTGKLPKVDNLEFYTDSAWLRGMCEINKILQFSLGNIASISDSMSGDVVVYDDRLIKPANRGDLLLWIKKLEEFENVVLQPLVKAVHRNKIEELVIHAGSHLFLYKKRHKYRFYRRKIEMQSICMGIF